MDLNDLALPACGPSGFSTTTRLAIATLGAVDEVEVTFGLIACPDGGRGARESYPPNACLYFYQCRECGTVIRPQPGDGW
jgi:hypothetical protein